MNNEDNQFPATDHDTLIRVHERLISLQEQIASYERGQSSLHNSIESRIKAIEQWKANLNGRFTVIATFSAFAGSILGAILINILKNSV